MYKTQVTILRSHQQLFLVVGVRRVLDQGGGGDGRGLDQLGGQEDGGRAQELELGLLQADGGQQAVHDAQGQEEDVRVAALEKGL